MPTLTITWHIQDDNACLICKALNGYTWVFEAGKDILTDALWHPVFGVVWSLADGSSAHGYHKRYNCRCHIEPHYNLEDVLAKCVFLKEILSESTEGSETE